MSSSADPSQNPPQPSSTTTPDKPPIYDHTALFNQGIQTRRAVVGDVFVDRALTTQNSEFSFPGQQLITEWCWGYTWNRPGLALRDRSMMNLVMLMALNRSTEFATHVRGARRNGLSELEIREVIVHATCYCGVPSGVEAFKVAERVFEEMKANGELERELGGVHPDSVGLS